MQEQSNLPEWLTGFLGILIATFLVIVIVLVTGLAILGFYQILDWIFDGA